MPIISIYIQYFNGGVHFVQCPTHIKHIIYTNYIIQIYTPSSLRINLLG